MLKIKNKRYIQDDPKKIWIKGEDLAKKFLKRNGYKILKRNYASRNGEIDIVAYERGVIAFVEVKTRLSESFGPPELAITNKKRRKIIRTALNYLTLNKIEEMDYRFDVVGILFKKDTVNPNFELLKNAFTADGAVIK